MHFCLQCTDLFFYCKTFFFLSTVVCLAKTVHQTPDNFIKNHDDSAMITCTHKIPSYDQILWYKQDMLGLKLMGYLYYSENIEPEFEKKIKLKGDAKKNGTLTIMNLTGTDSAVYLCAAYYTQ